MDQIFSHSDIISHLKTHYFDETSSTMLSKTCKTLHTCMMPMNYVDAKTIAITGAELCSISLLSYAIDLGYKPGIGSSAHAAAMGSVECLEFLKSINCIIDGHACTQALKYNHVNVFEWLKNNGIEHDQSSYVAAFETNDTDTIQWLLDNYPTEHVFREDMEININVTKLLHNSKLLPQDYHGQYKYAIKCNSLETIEFLFEDTQNKQIFLENIECHSICYKKSDIYDWCCARMKELYIDTTANMDPMNICNILNVIGCEDYMLEILKQHTRRILLQNIHTFIDHSIRHGWYKLFDHLLETYVVPQSSMFCTALRKNKKFIDHLIELNCPIDVDVFETALMCKNKDFVEYLIKQNCPWNDDVVVAACDDLSMLKYFKECGAIFRDDHILSIIDGGLECFKYISDNIDDFVWNENHLLYVAGLGDVETIDYIYNFCKDLVFECYDNAFTLEYPDEMIDWLYEHDCPKPLLWGYIFKGDNVNLLMKLRDMGFEYKMNFMYDTHSNGYYKCYMYAYNQIPEKTPMQFKFNCISTIPNYHELYNDKYVCNHDICGGHGHKVCVIKNDKLIELFLKSVSK